MRLLAVHPGGLTYSNIHLRLEPLGLELVAASARQAGHEVRLIDLQVETQKDYLRLLDRWDAPVSPARGRGPRARCRVDPTTLYVRAGQGRRGREIHNGTERFVEDTRTGVAD
jgi:hypothetical protein